jgi:hypothetical protein
MDGPCDHMMEGYEGKGNQDEEGIPEEPPLSETNAVQVVLVCPAPPAPTETPNALPPSKPKKPKMVKKLVDGEQPKKQFPWRDSILYVDTLVYLVHKHKPFAAKHGTTAQKWIDVAYMFNIEFKILNVDGTLRKQVMNDANPSGSLHRYIETSFNRSLLLIHILHLDPITSSSRPPPPPLTGTSAGSKFDTILEDFKTKLKSESRNKSGDDGGFNMRERNLRDILKLVEADGDERQQKKEKEAADEQRKVAHEEDFKMAKPRKAATLFAANATARSGVADSNGTACIDAKIDAKVVDEDQQLSDDVLCEDDAPYDWETTVPDTNVTTASKQAKQKQKGSTPKTKKGSFSSRSCSESPQTQPPWVSPEESKMALFKAQFAINEDSRAADKKQYIHTIYIYIYICQLTYIIL